MSSYFMVPDTAATPPLSPDGVPNLNLGVVTCSRYPAIGREEAFPKIIKKFVTANYHKKNNPGRCLQIRMQFCAAPTVGGHVVVDMDP
jgi:hypothetical protein